ncbi:hypothetical protein [Amycolatopsis cihanbeyliensis]|uniref:SPFH domain/Band 7 family protein n=1 Tax=Amycolatopsis cihanbeyliensis TaxID=1128664 RepID=A0A542DIA4_AMYCI|nr:hypothetical protein [Amycolatopsis cihanbeyliensis]TQJ02790.1 hypothetical protein FB471_2535 [Amycolatopsis cihanbeyliensis]
MTDPEDVPLLRRETPTRSELRKRNPVSDDRSAVVYLDQRGEFNLATSRLTAGEIWLDTPQAMYTVDIAPRRCEFELRLPSGEEAFFFTARAQVRWKVIDPVLAVARNVANVPEMLRPFLETRLRETTRRFGAESGAAAEREIGRAYGERTIPVDDGVAITRCVITLALDSGTEKHIAARTHAGRQQERRELAHTNKIQHLRLTEVESTHQGRLDELNAEHERRLAELQQQHELRLQQERMKVYADALRADDLNLLALRLAGHHEDVDGVLRLIMEQRNVEVENAKAVLHTLLDSNLVNRSDVHGIMTRASGVVSEQLRGRTALGIGAADGRERSPQLVGGTAENASDQDEDEDEDEDDI